MAYGFCGAQTRILVQSHRNWREWKRVRDQMNGEPSLEIATHTMELRSLGFFVNYIVDDEHLFVSILFRANSAQRPKSIRMELIICDPPWNELRCYLHASAFRLQLNGALKRGEIINVLRTNERRWATGDKMWIVFVSRKRTSQFIMTFWRTLSRFRANEHDQLTTANETLLPHKWSGPSFRWVSNGRK